MRGRSQVLREANPRDVGEIANADDAQAKLTLDQLALALRNLRPNHYLMPVLRGGHLRDVQPLGRARPARDLVRARRPQRACRFGLVSRAFRRAMPPDTPPRRIWVWRATAAYRVFAVGWTSMGYFLWAPDGDLNHLLIIMLLACTVAGNAALVGASKPLSHRRATRSTERHWSSTPLRAGDCSTAASPCSPSSSFSTSAYMSRQIYITARDMLLLRDDKSDLIAALAHAKTESDRRARARGSRQPREIAVPRQYEPRAAHAAERHSRLLGTDQVPHLREQSGEALRICRA